MSHVSAFTIAVAIQKPSDNAFYQRNSGVAPSSYLGFQL